MDVRNICRCGANLNILDAIKQAAAKGTAWESPRGPVSIDPETRDIVQTVYIRRVERIDGELRNIEFDRVENVKDPLKAQKK